VKKIIYILILILFSSHKSEVDNTSELWFSSITFTKLSRNFYEAKVRIVNISVDSVYMEVPYPHSFDLTASQNYFSSTHWGKKTDKYYFSSAKQELDSIGQVVIKNRNDCIVFAPKQIVELKFSLYCKRGYRNITMTFKYNGNKKDLLSYRSAKNNEYETIRSNLNLLK
jgi:hypothetical protein